MATQWPFVALSAVSLTLLLTQLLLLLLLLFLSSPLSETFTFYWWDCLFKCTSTLCRRNKSVSPSCISTQFLICWTAKLLPLVFNGRRARHFGRLFWGQIGFFRFVFRLWTQRMKHELHLHDDNRLFWADVDLSEVFFFVRNGRVLIHSEGCSVSWLPYGTEKKREMQFFLSSSVQTRDSSNQWHNMSRPSFGLRGTSLLRCGTFLFFSAKKVANCLIPVHILYTSWNAVFIAIYILLTCARNRTKSVVILAGERRKGEAAAINR